MRLPAIGWRSDRDGGWRHRKRGEHRATVPQQSHLPLVAPELETRRSKAAASAIVTRTVCKFLDTSAPMPMKKKAHKMP